MLLPAWSGLWLVMMPSTVMTAILLCAPLSSRMHSSSFGPTSRAVLFLNPRLKPPPIECEIPCAMMISQLNPSSPIKMMETIIQPQLRRGLAGGGGVMTGGGGVNCGGMPGEENEFSIHAQTNAKLAAGQGDDLPIMMHQWLDLAGV